MVAIVAIQILIVQFGKSIFNTVPLSLEQWVTIIGAWDRVVLRFAFRHSNSRQTTPGV